MILEEPEMTLTKGFLMSENMKEYLKGKVKYHETNVQVYFSSPVGIGEHPDIMSAIEDELSKVAEYKEKLDVLQELQRRLW
tara:strand:- start:80 stop:322 length:243 start_codon:yes stop_codon:yes gene_type:complete